MEQRKALGARNFRQPGAFLRRGMSPADMVRIFALRIGGVIDGEICAVHQVKHVLVRLTRNMFSVRTIGDDDAVRLHPVAGAPARVIKLPGDDADFVIQAHRPMGRRLKIFDIRTQHRLLDRKKRPAKKARHQEPHVVWFRRSDPEPLARNENWREKGQAADMIEMRMAEKNESLPVVRVLHHRVAQPPHSGTAVKNDARIGCRDFNARGITPVDIRVRTGGRKAAAHAPELEANFGVVHWAAPVFHRRLRHVASPTSRSPLLLHEDVTLTSYPAFEPCFYTLPPEHFGLTGANLQIIPCVFCHHLGPFPLR